MRGGMHCSVGGDHRPRRVDAEAGLVMPLYLDLAHPRCKRDGHMNNRRDLEDAVLEAALRRIRPKRMTATAIMMGLLSIL